MSETKHSHGQWEIECERLDGEDSYSIVERRAGLFDDTIDPVCSLALRDESRERAALIAAAPELLAALEGMLEGIRPADQDLWTHLARYREAAEAALEKAKGT